MTEGVVAASVVVSLLLSVALRETIVNRTYGTHENLHTPIFTDKIWYLVLFTMVPRNSVIAVTRISRKITQPLRRSFKLILSTKMGEESEG